jgi:hypothetical protein
VGFLGTEEVATVELDVVAVVVTILELATVAVVVAVVVASALTKTLRLKKTNIPI